MLSLNGKHSCCAAETKTFGRKIRFAAQWLIPGALLMLIPKCPLCIVAYAAVVSGIGLSVSTASGVRV